MIVPGILVCSSFLISACMLIVPKALLISNATVIDRARGANWLNSFETVLFNMCSAVTVGTMLANFHMCGIMLVLRAVFNMLVRNASRRGPMCFR